MRIQDKYQLPLFILLIIILVALRLVSKLGNVIYLDSFIRSVVIFGAFLIGNKNKAYLISCAISLSLLPLNGIIIESLDISDSPIIFGIVPAISFCFYSLRFASKSNKSAYWEIFKIVSVTQFAISHALSLSGYMGLLTAILGYTFLFTRFIQLKSVSKMSRNIIMLALALITVFFMVYAKLKSNEANIQTTNALETYRQNQEIRMEIKLLEDKLDSTLNLLDNCQSDSENEKMIE